MVSLTATYRWTFALSLDRVAPIVAGQAALAAIDDHLRRFWRESGVTAGRENPLMPQSTA